MSLARIAPDDRPDAIRRLVVTAVGSPARSLERMTFGHGSIVYKVGLDNSDVIVRTHDDPALYAGTLANLDALRALGLPVPTVLAADLTLARYPFVYLVTDAFPGADLRFAIDAMTQRQMSRLAGQIVDFERRAMTLAPGRGYGFLPIGASGGYPAWIDAVRADRIETLDREPSLAIALARAAPRLDRIAPTCFLDDLTIKNVIVDRGALLGIVDFDVVCYGDPMYWLALTQVAVLSDNGGAARFYVDELIRLWEPTDDERANLALYSALHASEFLTWDLGDRARKHRLTTAFGRWLGDAP